LDEAGIDTKRLYAWVH